MPRLYQAGPCGPHKPPRPGVGTRTASGFSVTRTAWRFPPVSRGRLTGLLSPTGGRAPAALPPCPQCRSPGRPVRAPAGPVRTSVGI